MVQCFGFAVRELRSDEEEEEEDEDDNGQGSDERLEEEWQEALARRVLACFSPFSCGTRSWFYST